MTAAPLKLAPLKLALVTGGCKRIGAVIATHLAQAGYALALTAHHGATLDPAVVTMCETMGLPYHIFYAELEDAAQVDALLPKVIDHFGQWPALLVNNAAMFEDDHVGTLTAAQLHRHYAVNLVAPALLTQAMAGAPVADPTQGQRARLVVNILDQRIAHPPADQLSYTLSKLALASLTSLTARHLAPHLRVCGVAPGLTLPTQDYQSGQMERLAAVMPLGKLSTPDDVAKAVVYLANNDLVTGQVLYVDGGAHMRAYDRDFLFMDD